MVGMGVYLMNELPTSTISLLFFPWCFFGFFFGSSRVLVALLEKQLAWLPESPYSTFCSALYFHPTPDAVSY